jgi:Trk-type K+ transport system membrane component
MIFGIFVIFGGISTALTNRLADFKNKRKYRNLDQIEEIHRDLHRRLVINICAIIVSLFTAALLFYVMEDWTFIKALYFAVQTATVSTTLSMAQDTRNGYLVAHIFRASLL